MNTIETRKMAKIAAEGIKRYALKHDDLRAKCKGECWVVIGVEPLCRDACKTLNAKRYEIDFGQNKFDFPSSNEIQTIRASLAFGRIFACAWNGHINGVMSSYNPKAGADVGDNRRGCLGFDITKPSGLFRKKEKNWARYYVSIQLRGADDELNERLAKRGVRILEEAIYEYNENPMRPKALIPRCLFETAGQPYCPSVPTVEIVLIDA